MPYDDVIAAVATARGVAGVAVVRVSGPGALDLARRMFRPKKEAEIEPRRAAFGTFTDAEARVIDEGYFLFLPGPATFTGQDVVELHTHGGLAAPAAVLSRLASLGARMAEPGEFTRRALESGRIDLAQAEAVLDVVHARSEAALRAANARLSGALSGRVNTIRDRLITARALVEAAIDFEETETDEIGPDEIPDLLASVAEDLDDLAGTYRRGRIYREGAVAVITGRPNVGKSSLLNALLGRRRAIVAKTPGTTRDAVEDEAVLDGVPFRLVDTAGLRSDADLIESAGIEIAQEKIREADLVLFVIDASAGFTEEDREIRSRLPVVPVLGVANKSDLVGAAVGAASAAIPLATHHSPLATHHSPFLLTSALTGQGVDELAKAMAAAVSGDGSGGEETALLAHERHHQQTSRALDRVRAARDALLDHASPAIVALEISDAQKALGEILGETTPDDVLNLIFSRFCIGK